MTVGVEGLPAGVSATVAPNPAIGPVTVDIFVPAGTAAVSYPFYLVASRDGTQTRLPALLSVVTPSVATFTFTPTAVAPVAGEAFGFGISAASSAVSVARGTAASFDVQVVPRAGFVSPIALSLTTPQGWAVNWVVVGPNLFRVNVTPSLTAASGANALALNATSGTLSATLNFTATVA